MIDAKWDKVLRRNERRQKAMIKRTKVELYAQTDEDEYLIIEQKYGKKIKK